MKKYMRNFLIVLAILWAVTVIYRVYQGQYDNANFCMLNIVLIYMTLQGER